MAGVCLENVDNFVQDRKCGIIEVLLIFVCKSVSEDEESIICIIHIKTLHHYWLHKSHKLSLGTDM